MVGDDSALTRAGGSSWEPTRVLAVLAGVLAVVFLVVLGFRVFGQKSAGQDAATSVFHERAIVAAAQAATTAFLDVDYTDMGPRMVKVLSLATGTFFDRYKAAEDELSSVTREGKVRSEGEVRYVGLSKVSSNSALAYVAADSTTTNTGAAVSPTSVTAQVRHYRFRVELRLVEGSWLVSELEFVR